LFWTLYDTWPFTGGCHYPLDCGKYKNKCGFCPQIKSNHEYDLSRLIWRRKSKAWNNLELTIVCPSHWMAERARESSLFSSSRIETIANGIDLKEYFPRERKCIRNLIGLPQDKRLILFSAIQGHQNIYKGYNFLEEIFSKVLNEDWREKIEIVILGSSKPEQDIKFHFPVNYLGLLHDEISLSLVYSSADLFIAPSIADNLPNTILEALACGTPCVAFDVGGIPDQIEHMKNGYLAQPFDTSDFAKGINWCLEDNNRWNILSKNARYKAEISFDLSKQSQKYIELYKDVLISKRNG
jgi:glycosyltransferase involved in cell wall biosynthesis